MQRIFFKNRVLQGFLHVNNINHSVAEYLFKIFIPKDIIYHSVCYYFGIAYNSCTGFIGKVTVFLVSASENNVLKAYTMTIL